MGYQNLGGSPPRFYIDYLSYNKAIGNKDTSTDHSKHIGLNSSGQTYTTTNGNGRVWISPFFTSPMPAPRTDILDGTSTSSGLFMGCLGHNAASAYATGMAIDASIVYSDGNLSYGTDSQIANWEGHATSVPLNGFTLNKKIDPSGLIDIQGVQFRFYIGSESLQNINLFVKSLVFGQYYNMPTNPDLKLTMSHEYDGVKTIQTKGGSTLSNMDFHGPAKWGDSEAWQLGDFPYYYSGRRTWSLSWSYVSDTDVEPYSYYGNKWDSDTDGSPTHSEGDDNWFQNVLHYTMGGHLPFIFSPDPSIVYYNNETNPPRVPEFAVCRLDMRSYKRTQISFKTYNIKVKIVESW